MAFLQTYGMSILIDVLALVLIFVVLLDVFEVMILPRRVTRPLRLSSITNRLTWAPWVAIGRHIKNRNRRENFLGIYGPIGLLFLLFMWAVGLIAGFALLQWACGSAYSTPEKILPLAPTCMSAARPFSRSAWVTWCRSRAWRAC